MSITNVQVDRRKCSPGSWIIYLRPLFTERVETFDAIKGRSIKIGLDSLADTYTILVIINWTPLSIIITEKWNLNGRIIGNDASSAVNAILVDF